jgi:hypothetical protein
MNVVFILGRVHYIYMLSEIYSGMLNVTVTKNTFLTSYMICMEKKLNEDLVIGNV